MEEIELKLTVNEVNQVLEALGQLPYARIYQLIHKVQDQAQQQIRAAARANHAPSYSGGSQPDSEPSLQSTP
ncbi:MAG: hypothetical protein GDA56_20100 [Hormoscilla sp. GM7CHS1pb]|nr:hypothetical protein [Hormoscilla sp. GM7CHS1pb]